MTTKIRQEVSRTSKGIVSSKFVSSFKMLETKEEQCTKRRKSTTIRKVSDLLKTMPPRQVDAIYHIARSMSGGKQ
jgi:hypothetical protein